jgi:hypothetical protein
MSENFEPTGVKWKSDRGTEFMLVTSGNYKDWVLYRHPDGQWVTSHKPSEIDRLAILDELNVLRHG